MESVKTYVQEDLTATIDCPVCKKSKRLSVAAFKNKKHTVRVGCICGTIFFALLEFRKERRKRVNLKGTYRTYSQYIDCEGKMLISDISRGGLLCQVTDYRGLAEGQILKLDYILDDIRQRKINKVGIICHMHGMNIGCEFMELKYFTGDIAPEWRPDHRDTDPIYIDTEPPKLSKNEPVFPWVLLTILLITGLFHLYDWSKPRSGKQNRSLEFKYRLLGVEKLDSQNNQMLTINKKIKHINEDSSKSSIDDQPRKEEQYYTVQKGDNLFKISSKNTITIHEIKVINEISYGEAISLGQKLD